MILVLLDVTHFDYVAYIEFNTFPLAIATKNCLLRQTNVEQLKHFIYTVGQKNVSGYNRFGLLSVFKITVKTSDERSSCPWQDMAEDLLALGMENYPCRRMNYTVVNDAKTKKERGSDSKNIQIHFVIYIKYCDSWFNKNQS